MRPFTFNKLLLILIAVLTTSIGWSQDFSNKGKDFWVGYGSHVSMYNAVGDPFANGGSQNMVL